MIFSVAAFVTDDVFTTVQFAGAHGTVIIAVGHTLANIRIDSGPPDDDDDVGEMVLQHCFIGLLGPA